tara:strand:- start:403 stop:687 length:285 start_codon:yes stop_codon:yes gene_type:complete
MRILLDFSRPVDVSKVFELLQEEFPKPMIETRTISETNCSQFHLHVTDQERTEQIFKLVDDAITECLDRDEYGDADVDIRAVLETALNNAPINN